MEGRGHGFGRREPLGMHAPAERQGASLAVTLIQSGQEGILAGAKQGLEPSAALRPRTFAEVPQRRMVHAAPRPPT